MVHCGPRGRPKTAATTTSARRICWRWNYRPVRQFELYSRSRHRTAGRWRPSQHLEFQILSHRGNNEAGGPFVEPPRTSEIQGSRCAFFMPQRGLGNYPVCRRLVIRRSVTRGPYLSARMHRVQELRVLHLFTPDSGVYGLIDPILCK